MGHWTASRAILGAVTAALVTSIFATTALQGCAGLSREELVSGKACDADGACLPGYACDPATGICVPEGTLVSEGGGGTAGAGGVHQGGEPQGGGCSSVGDCPAPQAACEQAICLAGACGVIAADQGSPLPPAQQVAGDCRLKVCDAAMNVVEQIDDGDVPDDGNDCTTEACNGGVPQVDDRELGVPCGMNGVCDGAGQCSDCTVPSDCDRLPPDDECQARSCVDGMCGQSFTAQGFVLSVQTNGDCKRRECDGAGHIVLVDDDDDAPDDGNACTVGSCSGGVAMNDPVVDGTPCGGAQSCVAGMCTGCTDGADCPGTDTECRTRTCTSGVCGFDFALAGVATSQQTAGDCQELQCDGMGAVVSADDNADVPADDGFECTGETCVNGSPQHPPEALNQSCMGSMYCDGAGQCVACNVASQCPQGGACEDATCIGHGCGLALRPAGALAKTSAQTAGDCRKVVCTQQGTTTSQADATDLPVDGNECTADVCQGVNPMNPPLPGSPCAMGTGTCDGSGQCVPNP